MSDTINTQDINEGVVSTDTPAENQQPTAKTFTQDELNRIVSERLKEDRQKRERAEKPDPLAKRLAELSRREFMLTARETLTEKGLSHDLLSALNTTNKETFEKSLEVVQAQINQARAEGLPHYSATTGSKAIPKSQPDDVRKAMGLTKQE